ncbi:amino acid ABC transporter ATP-binding protein [Paraburkholderia tropica]|uniref:Amino acid ABC transporter ATP-binding protein, PAAT family n=1 Tax=Paraburkholderia tropica TaxID=92647 RepID=A0AAQ1JWM2_9BURK|nr:amino acid ABC transporter ATP-binding protein [Paraburkholderia tropica]SEK07810.1 amino acid ABC transporter ATP-binding protein, PAAT family [Paraburkholderia tropica]
MLSIERTEESAAAIARPVAISMRGIDKWYGAVQVLSCIDLDVHAGETVVICGPSGSGKSTLIRCINGLESHQKGFITVNGQQQADDLKVKNAIRREAGMVFQHFNLYPHLTVLQNCTLSPQRVLKMPKKEAQALAERYLHQVRLSEHVHKYPEQLSGGQQQRVAIARALCMRPKVMLFDEPTSALDPELVREVLDTMRELARNGMTMVCVTHEMAFAKAVADKVVFMDAGRIVMAAPPAEFFDRPSHPRLRSFLSQVTEPAFGSSLAAQH